MRANAGQDTFTQLKIQCQKGGKRELNVLVVLFLFNNIYHSYKGYGNYLKRLTKENLNFKTKSFIRHQLIFVINAYSVYHASLY